LDFVNRESLIRVAARVIELRNKTILTAPSIVEARKRHPGWRKSRELSAALAELEVIRGDIESRCNAPFWSSIARGTLKRGWKNPLLELRREVEKAVSLAREHIDAKAAGRRPKTALEVGIRRAFEPAIQKADSLLREAYEL